MTLRWTSALSIGVANLDAEHAELFRRVDRLLDAMIVHDRSEAARLLPFLSRHVRDHFAGEERLMRELDYPETAAHVAEHAAFAAAIGDLVVALEAEGPSARLVVRLERDVTRWIHDHVYSTDLALGRFILARQGSAPPDAPVAEGARRPREPGDLVSSRAGTP